MTRIDFYSNAEPKLQVACQLVAEAVQQQSRVVVYAPDDNTARAFDKLLWAHRAPSSETLVVIARRDCEMAHYQVILNLHADSPPSFSRFERLVVLVAPGAADPHLAPR